VYVVASGTKITKEARDKAISAGCAEIAVGLPARWKGYQGGLPAIFEEDNPEPTAPPPTIEEIIEQVITLKTKVDKIEKEQLSKKDN
jgi:hypothetical protein